MGKYNGLGVMGVRSDRRQGNGERGALFVEIALVVSLLVLMSASVVEIGRYMAVWHGVNSAVRQGADYATSQREGEGAPSQTDCSEIMWAAVTASGLADLGPTDVSVTYEDATGQQIHACTVNNDDPDALPDGARVIVSVVREVDPLTPPVTRLVGQLTVTARDSAAVDARLDQASRSQAQNLQHADGDQVDGHYVVEEPGEQQDQHPGHDGKDPVEGQVEADLDLGEYRHHAGSPSGLLRPRR